MRLNKSIGLSIKWGTVVIVLILAGTMSVLLPVFYGNDQTQLGTSPCIQGTYSSTPLINDDGQAEGVLIVSPSGNIFLININFEYGEIKKEASITYIGKLEDAVAQQKW